MDRTEHVPIGRLTTPGSGLRRLWESAVSWLREHDRGFSALRRATRTAIVMPLMFALGDKVIGNPALATFAAFGSFAMLLLVDFQGPIVERLEAQAGLAAVCCVFICLGTLASRTTWLAAVAMAVVGFGVLFAGVISSTLVGASTSLLLAFILPVSLPGPVSSIPDRVAGWGLAAVAGLIAIAVLWPAPGRAPVRGAAIAACRALAARLRADIAYVLGGYDSTTEEDHAAAVAAADQAVQALHQVFFATPYRPTGLTTSARAVVRLVDELQWLNRVVLRTAPRRHQTVNVHACAVKTAAASALESVAELLDAPRAPVQGLQTAVAALRQALEELERDATIELPAVACASCEPEDDRARAVVSALDPSFRARELSFIVSQIARNTEYAVAAERRTFLQRWLGRQPQGIPGLLQAAGQRASAHVERNSVWLHNSLRGAAGLALAVLVADLSGVQHGFWVVFGTLSVLRSNALSTGQNIVRALIGTTAGFVIGGALVYVIGTNTTVLWIILPFAVLLAGLAPAAISFAAGQAAFTLTLLILFNILAPAGLDVGLVRIEDVALGSAVSLAVGLLFWPRGAAGRLGQALSDAYVDVANYLASAVSYGTGRCDASGPRPDPPTGDAIRAAAASRRLDDTFRGYLSERGAKPVPLAEVTILVNGIAGLRLGADALVELWETDRHDGGDRASARAELLAKTGLMIGWYDRFALSLVGRGNVPEPLGRDQAADDRLVESVGRDLRGQDGAATATGVRVIWTSDHLDAARRLQDALVGPARAAVSQHALV
jgi:uncharacterized membrane protein YccC